MDGKLHLELLTTQVEILFGSHWHLEGAVGPWGVLRAWPEGAWQPSRGSWEIHEPQNPFAVPGDLHLCIKPNMPQWNILSRTMTWLGMWYLVGWWYFVRWVTRCPVYFNGKLVQNMTGSFLGCVRILLAGQWEYLIRTTDSPTWVVQWLWISPTSWNIVKLLCHNY